MYLIILRADWSQEMFAVIRCRVFCLPGASKKIGLEMNAEKTKYVVIYQEQNAGRSQIVKTIIFPLRGWKSSDIWEQT